MTIRPGDDVVWLTWKEPKTTIGGFVVINLTTKEDSEPFFYDIANNKDEN